MPRDLDLIGLRCLKPYQVILMFVQLVHNNGSESPVCTRLPLEDLLKHILLGPTPECLIQYIWGRA